MIAEGGEDGVGDVADAGLNGKKVGGDAAGASFGGEEVGDIAADADSGFVGGREGGGFVLEVGFDDTGDFRGVDADGFGADAIGGAVDGEFAADGRIVGLVDVVEAAEGGGVAAVEFEEDAIGAVEEGVAGADRGGQDGFAGGRDLADFDDGPMERTEEAVTDGLGQQREVHVEEADFPGVDLAAEFGVGLIGSAKGDGMSGGEGAVEGGSGGRAGKDADFEGAAGGVLGFGLLGEGEGDEFGGSGGGESGEANGGVM